MGSWSLRGRASGADRPSPPLPAVPDAPRRVPGPVCLCAGGRLGPTAQLLALCQCYYSPGPRGPSQRPRLTLIPMVVTGEWNGAGLSGQEPRAARIKIPLENPSCSSGRQGGEDDADDSQAACVQTELHVMFHCHSFTKRLGPRSQALGPVYGVR